MLIHKHPWRLNQCIHDLIKSVSVHCMVTPGICGMLKNLLVYSGDVYNSSLWTVILSGCYNYNNTPQGVYFFYYRSLCSRLLRTQLWSPLPSARARKQPLWSANLNSGRRYYTLHSLYTVSLSLSTKPEHCWWSCGRQTTSCGSISVIK